MQPPSEPTPPPTPPPARPSALGRIVRLGAVVVVLGWSAWYIAEKIEWTNLKHALSTIQYGWVVVGIFCTLGAHVARAVRWRLLIPQGSGIRLLDAFSATIIGYLMNNVIPRSGELVRPYVLAQRAGRAASGLLATVLVERVLDGVTLAALFVILLLEQRDRLSRVFANSFFSGSSTDVLITLILPIAAIAVFIVLVLRTRFGDVAVSLIGRFLPASLGVKLTRLLHNFREGVTLGGFRSQIAVFAWTIVIWVGYGGALYCTILAFGFDTIFSLGPWDALTVLAITAVAVTIAPTPGAFGVYHIFCAAALTKLLYVPDAPAIAFALVAHAAPYLAVMLVGAGFLVREQASIRAMRKRKDIVGPVDG